METKHENVVAIANEIEDSSLLLNSVFQEQRLLAKISELQRSQDMINSTYYWRRLENLCDAYIQLRNNINGKNIR